MSQAAGEGVPWEWPGVDLLSRSCLQGPPTPTPRPPACVSAVGVFRKLVEGGTLLHTRWPGMFPEPERDICDEKTSRRSREGAVGEREAEVPTQTPPGPKESEPGELGVRSEKKKKKTQRQNIYQVIQHRIRIYRCVT